MTADAADGFTSDVLAWGVSRLRDLPWRHTRDPWAVLVSEVMLQQTQVARVIPRWHAFLERFPTPAACAAASLGDVLVEWQGLGSLQRRLRAFGLDPLREVARQAGIAPNSFYRQFRDMDELAVALIDRAGQSLRSIIGPRRMRSGADDDDDGWC